MLKMDERKPCTIQLALPHPSAGAWSGPVRPYQILYVCTITISDILGEGYVTNQGWIAANPAVSQGNVIRAAGFTTVGGNVAVMHCWFVWFLCSTDWSQAGIFFAPVNHKTSDT